MEPTTKKLAIKQEEIYGLPQVFSQRLFDFVMRVSDPQASRTPEEIEALPAMAEVFRKMYF